MVGTTKIRRQKKRHPWSLEPSGVLARVPLPYPVTVAIVGLVVLAEQLLEYSLVDPLSRVDSAGALLVLPLLTVYILLVWRVLKARIRLTIGELWPVVQVSDREYDAFVQRMITRNPRIELVVLALAITTTWSLYILIRNPLLPLGSPLPANLPVAGFFLATHTLVAWVVYSFLTAGFQYAWALGALARRPLLINVFDPSRVLPFGRLSLVLSVASAGLFLIPVILLGWPKEAGYILLGLTSLTGLMTLVVPVWGVHRQMGSAKNQALIAISAQFRDIQAALQRGTELKTTDLNDLESRSTSLIALRKAVLDTPSWPFRSVAAIVRAVIAALSPLIFVVLSELIKYGVAALLTRP